MYISVHQSFTLTYLYVATAILLSMMVLNTQLLLEHQVIVIISIVKYLKKIIDLHATRNHPDSIYHLRFLYEDRWQLFAKNGCVFTARLNKQFSKIYTSWVLLVYEPNAKAYKNIPYLSKYVVVLIMSDSMSSTNFRILQFFFKNLD